MNWVSVGTKYEQANNMLPGFCWLASFSHLFWGLFSLQIRGELQIYSSPHEAEFDELFKATLLDLLHKSRPHVSDDAAWLYLIVFFLPFFIQWKQFARYDARVTRLRHVGEEDCQQVDHNLCCHGKRIAQHSEVKTLSVMEGTRHLSPFKDIALAQWGGWGGQGDALNALIVISDITAVGGDTCWQKCVNVKSQRSESHWRKEHLSTRLSWMQT